MKKKTKDIESRTKQSSLINQKIRNAHFVDLDEKNKERFKYCRTLFKDIGLTKTFQGLKGSFKKNIQRTNLLSDKIDWSALRNDFGEYLLEASVEGVAINFALHFVFGIPFTILTALAYGIGYKQTISFYWRLKKDGSNKSIFKENK